MNIIPKIVGFLINIISLFSSRLAALIALKLFSTPKKGHIKKSEVDFLDSAFREEIKYDNLSIMTYRWLGKKDTIILAHGWESNSFRWKQLIETLKPFDYNIIALDAPAHGSSGGNNFNALLYAECIHVVAKKFNANIIIGHSVGGMAAVFFQHKYQLTSINKLILLGAPSNFTGVFKRYTKMMGYHNRVINQMNQLVLERYNQLPEYFSAAKFSEQFTIDGLLIHDIKDRIIPHNDAEDFKTLYKNAKLISTEGLGHSLASETVNDHILAFISN